MLFFISLKFSVLQEIPVEESEKDSRALALLLGIGLIEKIGEHIVVFNCERTGLKLVSIAHNHYECDILYNQE